MTSCTNNKSLVYKASKINELLKKIDEGYVLTKDLLEKLERINESDIKPPDINASLELVDSIEDIEVERLVTEDGYDFKFKFPKTKDLEIGNGLIYKDGVLNLATPNFTVNINEVPFNTKPSGKVTGEYPDLILELNLPREFKSEDQPEPEDQLKFGNQLLGPKEPVTSLNMYYGYVPYDTTGEKGYSTLEECSFKKVTKELLRKGNVIEIEPCTMNRTKISDEVISPGSRVYVLLPKECNYIATKDNGFGSKIPFNTKSGGECAKGEYEVTIDGNIYEVYGEDVTSSEEMYIYVDQK